MANNLVESLTTPSDNDVLCGRGKKCFEHEGNRRFRLILAESIDTYIQADGRKKKTVVVRAIIQKVLGRGGRFLKKHSKGGWYDAGMQGAKAKVGHSLRDGSTDRVKCLTKMRKSMTKISKDIPPSRDVAESANQVTTEMKTTTVNLPKDTKRAGAREENKSDSKTSHRRVVSFGEQPKAVSKVRREAIAQDSKATMVDLGAREESSSDASFDFLIAHITDPNGDLDSVSGLENILSAYDSPSESNEGEGNRLPKIPTSITIPSCIPQVMHHAHSDKVTSVDDNTIALQLDKEGGEGEEPVLTSINPFDDDDFQMLAQPSLVSLSDDDLSESQVIQDSSVNPQSLSCDMSDEAFARSIATLLQLPPEKSEEHYGSLKRPRVSHQAQLATEMDLCFMDPVDSIQHENNRGEVDRTGGDLRSMIDGSQRNMNESWCNPSLSLGTMLEDALQVAL